MDARNASLATLGGRTIRTRTLDNGLFVVACESRSAPVAALQVWVGVGSADERDDQAGIAHVHEHMLFKGTSRRGVGEIASEIERSGGEINAWTSYDQTVYHVVIASRFFDAGLDILSDAILRSAFDPGELSRELEVILEEIKRSEDQPSSKTSRALFRTAFHHHPYRRPVIGYADVVRRFTRDDILDFYRSHYCADRMAVVAVGDFDADETLDRIGRAFAEARPKSAPLPVRPHEPEQEGLRAAGLAEDVEESHLAIGFRGPRLLDPDVYAVDVLGVILGQGDSSRLSRRIKREAELVNEIYAYSYTPRDPGLVVVGATLRHEKIDGALAAVGAELDRVSSSKVSPDELEKAKAMLASEAIYQRETVEGLARRLGTWASLTGDPSFEERYQERIAAVTADDVQRAAERYLRAERATVVALVPRSAEALVETERLQGLARQALAPRSRPKASRAAAAQSAGATANPTLFTLEGGTRLVVERDPTNPIVSLRAVWLGGLRAESDATAGWSHLVAEMATKGTRRRGAVEIATLVDGMAGHIDGFAGRNSMGLRATFLKPSLERGFELFSECISEPAFEALELERTRTLVLEDLRSRADNPAGLAFDLFAKALWLEHPYRRDILGTPASVRGATSEALGAFWASHAAPHDAVLALVGDVNPEHVARLVESAFALARSPARASTPPREEPAPTERRVARLVRPKAQAHLVLGHRGLSLTDPDRFALEVMSSTLSGQGGRLFVELRDKQSLCYAVSAFSVEGIDPGSFAIYMGTSPEKVDTALAGIEALLDRLASDGITPAELDRAKRYLTGSHDIGLQRLGARASAMALNELYGLGFLSHREYAERLSAVTLDDVRRVASRVLVAPRRVLAIVGPEGTGGPAATHQPRGLLDQEA